MSNHKKAVIALIIANIIWGAASPIFKWSLTNIPPFTLAFLRFSIAAILLFPFTFKNLYIEAKDYLKMFGIGFFGVGMNIIFFFLGLKLTSSINAPIIASAGPVLLVILSIILLREKPKKKIIIGTILSLLGVMLIIFEPLLEKGMDGNTLGNFYLLLATLGAVFHALISKKVLRKYDSLPVTFWSFIIGSLIFLPLFLKESSCPYYLSGLNYQGIIGIIFGAVFSSAIAYVFYEWGVKNLPASETGVFTYIDPVIAIIIAIPLLGEIPNPVFIIGSIIVFLGIILAEGKINVHPVYDLIRLVKKKIDLVI